MQDFKEIVKHTLAIGQIHKNYKAICQVLGQEVKKDNSKKSQLKTWKQYFNWETQGQKWIITEIYDEIQEREDGRKDNTSHKQATLGLDGELLFRMTQIDLLCQNGEVVVLDEVCHDYELVFVSKNGDKFYYNEKADDMIIIDKFSDDYLKVDHDKLLDFQDIRATNVMKQDDLCIQLGMRSPLFKPLDDNKHLFTTHKISSLDDYYCHAQTHNVVFYDIYQRQRSQIENMKIVGLENKTLIYEYVKIDEDDETTKGELIPHLADIIEQAIIEDCRNVCIDNWNNCNKKKLETFGEVFNKLNYGEKQLFLSQLDELLKESFDDNYSYCSSVFVYRCRLRSEIAKLQALGCDITVDNYDKFISHWSPFLQGEINKRALKYRYEHIDNKLQKQQNYDSQRQEVRHYGKTRHDKYEYANTCLIHEYDQAKVLVRLAFSVDLTEDDYKFVEKLLDK